MRTQSKHYEAFAVLTALKFWPQRSVNHPQPDIFSKSWECLGWRDYPSPLTITWLYVISSTKTNTDHRLPQTRVYCSLHVSFYVYEIQHSSALCLPVAERNLIKTHLDGNFIQQECLLRSQWNISEADQNLKWRWGENWIYLFELALPDFHVNSYFISFWMFCNTSTTL